MARASGRNLWLAWPAWLLIVAVVAALAWLARPMLPVVGALIGDSLRAVTTTLAAPVQGAPESEPGSVAAAVATADPASVDCRSLYPDDLWAELVWRRDVVLSQSLAAPASAVTALTDALAPSVAVTCEWRGDRGRTIRTTLAIVPDDAAVIADAALRSQGFACDSRPDDLVCTRTSMGVTEEHVVRGALWLSTAEVRWRPEEYTSRMAAHIWG